jgi:hypothetical protein
MRKGVISQYLGPYLWYSEILLHTRELTYKCIAKM